MRGWLDCAKSGQETMPHPQIKFGTDGWRGVIADDFTFQNVRTAAEAIAAYGPAAARDAARAGAEAHRDDRCSAGQIVAMW